MGAGVPFVHDLFAGHHSRQRQARGDALSRDDDVGGDAVVFHRKELSRAAEARLDLVGDQHDAVCVTDGTQTLQKRRRWHHIAAFAEHRLDEDGRHVVGGRVGMQDMFDSLERVTTTARLVGRCGRHTGTVFADRLGNGTAITAGIWCDMYARRQWCIAAPVFALAGGQCHCTCGAAVEATVEHDDVGPAGGMARQFEGRFDCFSARVAKEERIDAGRNNLTQPFDQA